MNKEDIRIDDWHRILIGQAPVEFLWEVLCRALIIYLLMLLVVRLLGKRMTGQLTLTEMAVMLTMGAVISPSLEAPDRGILLGVVAMICTLTFQRGTTWFAFRNVGFEHLTQGQATLMIKDGILQLGNLADTRVSRQQVFAQLRGQSIYKLSQVKRLYMEAEGDFSIYKAEEDKPGFRPSPPTTTRFIPFSHCRTTLWPAPVAAIPCRPGSHKPPVRFVSSRTGLKPLPEAALNYFQNDPHNRQPAPA